MRIRVHRAAHYALTQPRAARRAPAQGRICVKDLCALCARSPAHTFLSGVYEVNHTVHTYVTYIHMRRASEPEAQPNWLVSDIGSFKRGLKRRKEGLKWLKEKSIVCWIIYFCFFLPAFLAELVRDLDFSHTYERTQRSLIAGMRRFTRQFHVTRAEFSLAKSITNHLKMAAE